MSDFFDRALKLFDGILYKDVIKTKSYVYLSSYFKTKYWNLVIPTVSSDQFNFEEFDELVSSEKLKDREVSLYIPENLNSDYSSFVTKQGYSLLTTDSYLYCRLEKKFDVSDENYDLLSQSNIQDQLYLAEVCIPDMDNKEYTELFEYNHKPNIKDKFFYNVLRYKDAKAVAFGFLVVDKQDNLAYLHNAATHPDYRKKGFFKEMVKYRCNLALDNQVDEIFAIVESGGVSNATLTKLGFEEKEKYYIYSK